MPLQRILFVFNESLPNMMGEIHSLKKISNLKSKHCQMHLNTISETVSLISFFFTQKPKVAQK